MKSRCDQLEEDKRTVEIKNAGLGDAISTLHSRVDGLQFELSLERELRSATQLELARELAEKGCLAHQVEELQGNNRILAEEIDHMVCGMSGLQAEVEGFASGEKIAPAARKKVWDEIVESEDFVDMQLAIEVRIGKRI